MTALKPPSRKACSALHCTSVASISTTWRSSIPAATSARAKGTDDGTMTAMRRRMSASRCSEGNITGSAAIGFRAISSVNPPRVQPPAGSCASSTACPVGSRRSEPSRAQTGAARRGSVAGSDRDGINPRRRGQGKAFTQDSGHIYSLRIMPTYSPSIAKDCCSGSTSIGAKSMFSGNRRMRPCLVSRRLTVTASSIRATTMRP